MLYKSIGTGNPKDGNYLAGYELFLMVIVGSSVYVLMNAVSIVHYGVVHHVVFFPNESLSIIIAGIFFAGWVLLLVLRAPELATYVRCVRRKLGNWHFAALVVLVSLDVIIVGIMLQYRPCGSCRCISTRSQPSWPRFSHSALLVFAGNA